MVWDVNQKLKLIFMKCYKVWSMSSSFFPYPKKKKKEFQTKKKFQLEVPFYISILQSISQRTLAHSGLLSPREVQS